jgi:hypothetical protein
MALHIFKRGTSRSYEPHAPIVLSPPLKSPSNHRKGGCAAASAARARILTHDHLSHSLILAHITSLTTAVKERGMWSVVLKNEKGMMLTGSGKETRPDFTH